MEHSPETNVHRTAAKNIFNTEINASPKIEIETTFGPSLIFRFGKNAIKCNYYHYLLQRIPITLSQVINVVVKDIVGKYH